MRDVDDRGRELAQRTPGQGDGRPVHLQPQGTGLEAARPSPRQRGGPLAHDLEPERRVVRRAPATDELFLVLQGRLTIQLRDRDVVLGEQDVFVVPRGVEHRTEAEGEVHALLVEPRGTVNAGDAGGPRTSPLRELD